MYINQFPTIRNTVLKSDKIYMQSVHCKNAHIANVALQCRYMMCDSLLMAIPCEQSATYVLYVLCRFAQHQRLNSHHVVKYIKERLAGWYIKSVERNAFRKYDRLSSETPAQSLVWLALVSDNIAYSLLSIFER